MAEAGSLVRLYANGTEVGDVRADATTGAWSIASSTLADGVYTITATATDLAGNTSLAASGLSITIDTTAPATPAAPTLTAASDSFDGGTSFPGDTGIGTNSDDYTSDKTPTFTGVAEAGSLVRLYANGTEVGDVRADATTGAWSIASSTLADGAYAITATATDLAGNTSLASSGLSITIDTTAPATPAAPTLTAASDSGRSDSDDITNVNTPTFTGTAEAGSLVRLYANGTEVGFAFATGGNWSIASSTLADGAYTITATATDLAGNTSNLSGSLVVDIDTQAPAPSITDVSPNDFEGSLITLDGMPRTNFNRAKFWHADLSVAHYRQQWSGRR